MNMSIYYDELISYRDMSELVANCSNNMIAVSTILDFVAYKEMLVFLIGVDK